MAVLRPNPHLVPRWLLPTELAGLSVDEPRRRRTARDWVVDALLFLAALCVMVVESDGVSYYEQVMPQWVHTVDPYLGIGACLALWWRRRFPVIVAGVVLVAYLIGTTAVGAALVVVLTVAVHREWLTAVLVAAAYLAPSLWFSFAYPPPDLPWQAMVVIVVLMFLVPLGWGMAVRSRRQLVASLRRDAEHAVRDHERRLGDARRAERERIAREMHGTPDLADLGARRCPGVPQRAGRGGCRSPARTGRRRRRDRRDTRQRPAGAGRVG
jgi:signal transduction histidine kinase